MHPMLNDQPSDREFPPGALTVPKSKAAAKLSEAAQAAAEVRAYQTHPDVVAYKIERTNTWSMRLIWIGLVLGLAFTAVNVQQFAGQGSNTHETSWWTAWLLDPMVSLILIGVLIGEQNIARQGINSTRWIRATKWAALLATYSMNTWSSWAAGHADDIVLHSVPPLMVVFAAEAVTDLRHLVTRAVSNAHSSAITRAQAMTPPVQQPVPLTRTDEPRTDDDRGEQTEELAVRTPVLELIAADEDAASNVGIDRSEVVARLVGQILAAIADGNKWSPDYPDLMARTGRRRSWCEKAVREARQVALRTDDSDDGEDPSTRTDPDPYGSALRGTAG